MQVRIVDPVRYGPYPDVPLKMYRSPILQKVLRTGWLIVYLRQYKYVNLYYATKIDCICKSDVAAEKKSA